MSNDFTDALSGAGSGGGSISDLFSGMGNAFSSMFGGGGVAQSSDPASLANTSSATESVIDPSAAAQTALTAGQGQNAPTQSQGQNPQGQSQNQQGQNQTAPQSAIDQLKKALTALKQSQRENPYQIGGPTPSSLAAGQNTRQLNRAARIPTGQVAPAPAAPPNPADLPASDAQEVAMTDLGQGGGYPYEGASFDQEYGPGLAPGGPRYNSEGASNDPEYGPGLKPGGPAYPYEGESNQPEYGPGQPDVGAPYPEGPSYQPEYGPGRPTPALPAPGGPTGQGQIAARGATLPSGPPSPGNWVGPFMIGAGRRFGMGPVASGIVQALHPDPLQQATGVEAPRTLGRSPSGPPQEQPGPEDPTIQAGGPGHGAATTTAPETGKPVETVDPKTKKPVDPKTGDPLPTKKPHETPREEAPPSGEGPLMRDVRGGQSVPPLLGQLARIALPMLMMGLMGGFGGGGRGRGFRRIGGRFGHPGGMGGRNYWPYHHPSFGWHVHGFHPGGGWRPMDPRHFQGIVGGGFGGGPLGLGGGLGNAALGGGGPMGNQNGSPAGGPVGGRGGGETWQPSDSQPAGNPDASGGTASADDVLSMIRQRESGGTNKAPWDNYDYPNSHASGYYQFEPATWRAVAQQSGDAEAQKYPEAYLAPQAVQDRMARFALQKYGPNAEFTWAESGAKKGRPYPNVDPRSFASNQPGHTKTGGDLAPNPDGNLAPPPGVAVNPLTPFTPQGPSPSDTYQPSPI